MSKRNKQAIVYCPYCTKQAALVDSSIIYKSSYGFIWLCQNCDAYTGVHKSSRTFKPLGTLANKETRELRKKVHALFDPYWKGGKMTRDQAYVKLASMLNIDKKICHVAMFDEVRCRQAIHLLQTPF
jgi:hypothetical protein